MLTADMYIAGGILLVAYIFIFSEMLPRSNTAIVGAVVMVGAGSWFGFYTQEEAVLAVDANTILLLMAMMAIVAMLRPTGGFEYVGIRIAKLARGNPRVLLVYLCFAVSVISMFLDNVTTVIIFAPLTVLITRLLNRNPAPYLIAEAILSNVGGAATLVGDPPNIMIGSTASLDFMSFIVHMGPMVLPSWLMTVGVILFLFRKQLADSPEDAMLDMDLDERKAITDPVGLRKVSIALFVVIMLFFVHHIFHLFPAFVSWVGVAIALLWINPDPEELFKEVEWPVLLFFASLFIMVGGVEASGILDLIGHALAERTGDVSALMVNAVLLMWVAAILSALVDNIPFTVTMLPIIAGLESKGINVQPLWWALAVGVGFGGNATHIGATANIICVNEAERSQHPNSSISPIQWMKVGFPVMIVSLGMATLVFVGLFSIVYID